MESTTGFPFTAIGGLGGAKINGKGVIAQGISPQNKGAIVSTSNTEDAVFGRVVSVLRSAPNEVLVGGPPTSGVLSGVLYADASVLQNDPAKADYILPGLPCAVAFLGPVIYENWGTTQVGALAYPNIDSVIIYNTTTGDVEFLPVGGTPGVGWAAFPGKVSQVDSDQFQGVTIQLQFV